jgi:uncharacterized protein
MSERIPSSPLTSPETAYFWEAANRREFLVRWCTSCGQPHWYPRALCPHCGSSETVWKPGSGRGLIYSFSILRRGPGAPYCTAYVTLDEDVTMMTNILAGDFDSIRIGQAVEIDFIASSNGQLLPVFRQAAQ